MSTVTRKQAEQALAAVRHQFKAYIEPLVINGRNYGGSEPTLVENYDNAPFAIVWEDGPDEWAYRATSGGYSEEEHSLAVEAAKEFGVAAPKPREEQPVQFPKGVYAEPYYSFVLALYAD